MANSLVQKWVATIAVAVLFTPIARGAVFEIIALPDAENYTDINDGFPGVLAGQTQWIVDNRATENIAFVTQLGDIIHHNATLEMPEATAAMGMLDQPGQRVPYSVCAGNHELEGTQGPLFAQNFGANRYSGYSWYGGSYKDFNHYQVFSAGGYDFLHINLQKDPTAGALAWAQGVINANLGKPTIISTHDYLLSDTARSTAGTAIWNNLVKNNPQVFLTLNGHTRPTPDLGVAQMSSTNANDKTVLQVLSDFEDYTTQPNNTTDTGYLRKIIFDTDAGKITVQTYSPTYAAVPWLTDGKHQFSYDMAFLPQTLGAASGAIFVTDAATCTSAGYTQNFDNVLGPAGTTAPLGWTTWQVAGTASTFSNAQHVQPENIAAAAAVKASLLVSDAAPSGTWNNQAANAASDAGRALATNPGNNGAGVIQLKITNGLGTPVNSVHLDYDLKMLWESVNDSGSELPGYALFWSTTGSTVAEEWTKLGEDTLAGTKAWDITLPMSLEPGADIYLRWADDNVAGAGGESGAENVWGIDNVHVTMSPVPEPGTLILLSAAVAGLLGYGWYRRRR